MLERTIENLVNNALSFIPVVLISGASSVNIEDFKQKSQKNILGIIFYIGKSTVKFEENLYAIPLSIFL